MRKLLYVIGQVGRSFSFALESVVINKLRTALSLLGITIGIFAIISVFTIVDSLEINMREAVGSLGSDVVYIERRPWVPEEDGSYKWWKYANRPNTTHYELTQIVQSMPDLEAGAMIFYFTRNAKIGSRSAQITAVGATHQYDHMTKLDFEQGRYFTPYESEHGNRVAIIGSTIAEDFFEDGTQPLGQTITVGGTKVEIIGVLVKNGAAMMGNSPDNQIILPYNFACTMVNPRWANPSIILKASKDVDKESFVAEVTSAMRQIRRLGPSVESNFAVNEASAINKQLDPIFDMLNLVGGVIGIFSILVGGFGVANIMFVSVRERTSQIGIEKALGARSYFILLQFTFEAVLLSVVGGAVGLFLIFVGTVIVSEVGDFTISLTMGNIVLGLAISSIIGAVAGIFPAYSAARMDPVKAIFRT